MWRTSRSRLPVSASNAHLGNGAPHVHAGLWVRILTRRVRIAIAFALLIPLLPFVAFRAAVAWLPYPSANDQPILPSTSIVDRNGNPLAAFASLNGQWCL